MVFLKKLGFPSVRTCLPCVRNTNNCVCVFECGRQKLVGEYTCCICETEEAVVREDGSNSHEMGMQNAFMTHG